MPLPIAGPHCTVGSSGLPACDTVAEKSMTYGEPGRRELLARGEPAGVLIFERQRRGRRRRVDARSALGCEERLRQRRRWPRRPARDSVNGSGRAGRSVLRDQLERLARRRP